MFFLPLASKCLINVEALVDQLPPELRKDQLMLENTLASLEVFGSIHPKLIYYRIQYLNVRYSDSTSTNEARELLKQFNVIRNEEVRKKQDWFDGQLKMLKGNTNAFEYLRLKKYFQLPKTLPSPTKNDTVAIKIADGNGVDYFIYYNETKEDLEPNRKGRNYITLIQENRTTIYTQYQDWSQAIAQGTIPLKKSDIRKQLNYWYLFNDDGSLSTGGDTPIAILIRDYYRILFEDKSHFNFSMYTNLEQKTFAIRRVTTGKQLLSDGKVVVGSITTPKYLVSFGYTGKLIRYSNILSNYTVDLGLTIPEHYDELSYEGFFRYEWSVEGVPFRLEEVNYPHLKLTNILVSGISGELAVSLWKPLPYLSIDIGYAFYSEKRKYDFEYVREFSTYIFYVDGTTLLTRSQTDDLVVEHYTQSYSAEHLVYRVNYRLNDWVTIIGKYYPAHPGVKVVLTL